MWIGVVRVTFTPPTPPTPTQLFPSPFQSSFFKTTSSLDISESVQDVWGRGQENLRKTLESPEFCSQEQHWASPASGDPSPLPPAPSSASRNTPLTLHQDHS